MEKVISDREEQAEGRGERRTPEHRFDQPNGKYILGGIKGHVSREKWRQLEKVVTTGGRTKRRGRGEHCRLEISRGEIPWDVQSHRFLFLCYFFSLHFSSCVWIEGGLVRSL